MEDLHKLQRRNKSSNLGRLDRLALRWIREHPEVCVVDCDNNAGDAIADHDFVHNECHRLLDEGFEQISTEQYKSNTQDVKLAVDCLFFNAVTSQVCPKARVRSSLCTGFMSHAQANSDSTSNCARRQWRGDLSERSRGVSCNLWLCL